jgi:hypothetical protein
MTCPFGRRPLSGFWPLLGRNVTIGGEPDKGKGNNRKTCGADNAVHLGDLHLTRS